MKSVWILLKSSLSLDINRTSSYKLTQRFVLKNTKRILPANIVRLFKKEQQRKKKKRNEVVCED